MHPQSFASSDIIESFYIETREGLFFAVKGLVHPPDRIIGVVRYSPDPEKGERIKNGVAYRRLYHFSEQEQLLRSSFPQYLKYDPVLGTRIQSVPRSMIRSVYDPRIGGCNICESRPAEGVLGDAAMFLNMLHERANVPLSAIGISGSILIGLHNPGSDLDVSVFGMQSCRRVYQTLRGLLDSRSVSELTPLDASGIAELYQQRVTDTQMEFVEFEKSERNKICQGIYRGRQYFIRFLKEPRESGELYGEFRYASWGRALVEARVIDDQDAIFTPCRYLLSDVKILEGPDIAPHEIVSFRGRFCEQARTGEIVRAAGTIESIDNNNGDIRYRLLLGNSSLDTMTTLDK